jgi:hypothetical protein
LAQPTTHDFDFNPAGNVMDRRQLASTLFPRPIKLLDVLNQNARLNGWIREHKGIPHFEERVQLFDHVLAKVVNDGPIDYMEFGVHRGASIQWWIEHASHRESRFFGFDSFEGLPEAFKFGVGGVPAGHFDTGGQPPKIEDARVSFIKGWFQNTLPGFLDKFSAQSRLVIHCDADLYSSTLFVLSSLDRLLRARTILMFDEFSSHEEFRAFMDYINAFNRSYRAVASARRHCRNVAIEML